MPSEEYETIYIDSAAKKVEQGKILMSQDPAKSMHIEGAAISVTDNETLTSVRAALKQGFPQEQDLNHVENQNNI